MNDGAVQKIIDKLHKLRVVRQVRALGPYAAVELLLPGGSLIAFTLWAVRHHGWLAAHARRVVGQRGALLRSRIQESAAARSYDCELEASARPNSSPLASCTRSRYTSVASATKT